MTRDSPVDEQVALLRRIADALDVIAASVKRPARALSREDDAALRILFSTLLPVGDSIEFSACEVLEHVRNESQEVVEVLEATIGKLDSQSPKRLGKMFHRCEGVIVDRKLVRRSGEQRRGVTWEFLRV